jgi:hypothetical protein
MAAGLLGALLALASYRSAPAAEAGQLAIRAGFISAIAIAPDANGVVIGIEGGGGNPGDGAEVRWWNWNGKDGSWTSPSLSIGALAWDRDGFLLAGEREPITRRPTARWWRLGPDGTVLLECKAVLRFDGLIHAEEHGIHSIVMLTNGKVVTGGVDATLAVWEGCMPAWLHSWPCCHGDQNVTVSPRGDGFMTSGEAIWRGDERGFEQLGPRRWTPSPWTATPAGAPAKESELRADGEDCSAILDAEGRIAVSGAHPWQARIGAETWKLRENEEAWSRFAVSRDCTGVAAATSRRLVWTKSP